MNGKLFASRLDKALFLTLFFTVFLLYHATAQVPVITSFSPAQGIKGTTITINGSGFNATDTNNVVFIGATKAKVITAGTTALTVSSDTCNSYGPVQVLNTATGLSTSSKAYFTPTFTNTYFFPTFNFKRRIDFTPPPGTDVYIVAIGDLDNDNKSDLVVLSRAAAYGHITVYKNASTVGSISASSFVVVDSYRTSAYPSNVRVADLDGDGLNDIIVTSNATARVNVFQNFSTAGGIVIGAPVSLSVFPVGIKPTVIAIADFDGDGHPEISTTASDSDKVVIFRNLITAPGIITSASFDTAVGYRVGVHPVGIAAVDLDGDGKPDIVSADSNSNAISVLHNTASAGTISAASFAAPVAYAAGNSPIDVIAADIDGDGKVDVACSNWLDSTVSVFRNQSVPGTINLMAAVSFNGGDGSVGISAADFNGDGKVDIAMAQPQTSSISIFRNMSTSGSITTSSFASPVRFPLSILSGFPFGLNSGDLDGDGYPEIVSGNSYSHKFAILRDYPLPVLDTIAASGSTTLCFTGGTVHLSNTVSSGTWSMSNTSLATISTTGNVTALAPGVDTAMYTRVAGGDTNIVIRQIIIDGTPDAGTVEGPFGVCLATTVSLTDTASGGVWSSSAPSIATISTTGDVYGLTAGTANISYTVTNACGIARATHSMLVNSLPNSGTISGPSTVCATASITLTDTVAGGTWSSSSTATASVSSTGVVGGIAAGAVTISYIVNSGCGSDTSYKSVTVNPLPVAGTLSGASTVCEAANTTLSPTVTGGVWSSSNTARATVSTSGTVTGIAAGTVTISYAVTNSCGTARATWPMTVNPLPVAGVISSRSGRSGICRTGTDTMTSTAGGGVWAISSPSIATISTAGVVTALSLGTATITYTVTNTCGVAYDTMRFSIDSLAPPIGRIAGADSVCAGGATILLSDTTAGGVWSSSAPLLATVNATGLVTGLSGGSLSITYTVTNACGTNDTAKAITVKPLAAPGVITGPVAVCPSATITLGDTATGGTWSSSATATATVSGTGIVTGLTAGPVIISYTKSNTCGPQSATYNITVSPRPSAGPITGTATVCAAATTTLADTAAGGSWSSSNTGIASISTAGVVTGVAPGTAVITYRITNSCGNADSFRTVTVLPLPVAGTITGLHSVCAASAITLTDTASGGVWSSSASGTATVSTTGTVTGVAAGSAIITYSVTNSCGTATDTQMVTVNPLPVAGTLSGTATVCAGLTTTFSSTATGGSWSSSNTAVATINTTGVITALVAGTASISYTVTNGCGTARATRTVTVNPQPVAGTIAGLRSVCEGSAITLTDTASGGVWSSSASATATVSTTGTVTGVAGGSAIITYSVTNSCGTATDTQMVTVNPLPVAGTLSGTATVCAGLTTSFSSTATGGTWSSSNTAVATINTTGVITALVAGTANISYTVTNGCGTARATRTVTVNPQPVAGTIAGLRSVCEGSAITLTDTASGGVWSSSASTTATVSTTGTVTGVTAGSAIITYSVTNSCGTATDTQMVTVNPLPLAGTISGRSYVCLGDTAIWAATAAGGSWSSSNTALATVGGTGIITGVATGAPVISYTVANICGSASVSSPISVITLPATGVVTGIDSVCMGATIVNSGSGTITAWSFTNGHATVVSFSGTSATLQGITAGLDTLTYVATNVCGSTTSAPRTIKILQTPVAGTITGPATVCPGSTVTLGNTTASSPGVWSTSSTLATVNAAGTVRGIAAGAATITYTVNTAICGSAATTRGITVLPLPDAGTVSGTDSLCPGNSATFTSTISGVQWRTSAAAIATVSATTGVVTAVAPGSVVIYAQDSNACGMDTSGSVLIVKPAISSAGSISGADSACAGLVLLFTNPITGGVWSSSNAAIATVSGTGAVTAITGGTVIISYTVANSCGSQSATHGFLVANVPDITSPLSRTVCDSDLFTYVPAGSFIPEYYSWTRAAATGIANAAGSGTGSINDYLDNTGVTTATVRYTYIAANHGCYDTATVTVTVHPYPHLTDLADRSICSGTQFMYYDSITTGPTTISNWSRPAVTGITPVTATGTGAISDRVSNSTNANIVVYYTYILNFSGCTDTQQIKLTVAPAPAQPNIATHSPANVCAEIQYQNFGAANLPPAGERYTWYTTGVAQIWSTGADRQYCLVNFPQSGPGCIYLRASMQGSACTSVDSFKVNVSGSVSDKPEVLYFGREFIVLLNDRDSYQWGYDIKANLDSVILPGETNQHYTNKEPDFTHNNYWVITTKNGCMQKSYLFQPVGVGQVNDTHVTVAVTPNPNGGNFAVQLTGAVQVTAELLIADVTGRVVYHTQADSSGTTQVALDQPPGMYLLTVQTEYGRFTQKIVIR